MLHPGIRILTVLAVAAMLPALPLLDLLGLGVLALLGLRWLGAEALWRCLAALRRLKWLFLSIGVLYWGFTPGDPLWAPLPGLSVDGLIEGSRRMLVLAVLLAAVYLVLCSTPAPQLASALAQLAWPLGAVGLDRHALARRMALTLDAVQLIRLQVAAARDRGGRSLIATVAELLSRIEQDALRPQAMLRLERLPALPWWQLPLPLASGLGLGLLTR